MNYTEKVNQFLIVVVVAATLLGGVFVYRLNNKQRALEQLVPTFAHTLDSKVDRTERVVETVVQKTNPWGALQPKLKDAVVQVFSQVAEFNWVQPFQTPTQKAGTGSGFFIDANGYFITNAHVVDQAKAITIQIPSMGKEQIEVEIVSICFDRDIALLKIKDEEFGRVTAVLGKINYLSIGDSDKLQRAEEVMTVGFPLGQQGIKNTVGVVSGRENLGGRQYFQIDAAINPGNSGGPALNFNGDVIGVNTAIIQGAQNVGYIIPSQELKVVLSDLYHAKNPLVRRPVLGIIYSAATAELAKYLGNPVGGGCYVNEVCADSVLDLAGVKAGDMIYEINGQKLDYFGELQAPWAEDKISLVEYVSYLPIGEQVTLVVYRKGQQKLFNFEFKQGKLSPIRLMYPDFEKIDYEIFGGFVVMELTLNHVAIMGGVIDDLAKFRHPKNQAKPLLIITHIFPSSMAQRARLFEVGSLLRTVNGDEVSTLAELRAALFKGLKTGDLTIKTNQDVFAVLPFAKVLQQEPQLSAIYHYPITETMQKLIQLAAAK